MGVWGPGSFENDDAGDWVVDLCEQDSFKLIDQAIEAVVDADPDDEVDAPECCCALAAAEVVAALAGSPARDIPEDLTNWLADHPGKVSRKLLRRTLSAIGRIKKNSELKELWDEANSTDKWLQAVAGLESRLKELPSTGSTLPKKVSTKKMPKTKRGPKAKFGDILEIQTKIGLAYAIYTHRNKNMGDLIRVFDRIFESRPTDLSELHRLPIRFATFTRVSELAKSTVVSVIANLGVPKHLQQFPLFRSGALAVGATKVANWWFWDGEKAWLVGKLTAAQRKMPIKSIPSLGLLLHWLETGWRPELDSK
jgi:uncharacterized protein DUF4259